MFGYNPSVQDRSGELIGAGIGQAAQGISGALGDLNKLKLAGDQAQGTLGIAHSLGLIDDTYKQLPMNQQIGAASNIGPLINALAAKDQAAALGAYRAQMLGVQQQKAGMAADKTAPVSLY
jgi:hypothetical protein